MLVTEILRRTGEAGCYMVQLVSLKHRRGAHTFDSQLGFEPVAEGLRYYFEGFAAERRRFAASRSGLALTVSHDVSFDRSQGAVTSLCRRSPAGCAEPRFDPQRLDQAVRRCNFLGT
jgi:hypothetical protein